MAHKITIMSSRLDALLHRANSFLFDHEESQQQKRINALVTEHDQAMLAQGDEQLYGFIYNGEAHRAADAPVFHRNVRGLHPSLEDKMQDITRTRNSFLREAQSIRQILYMVLSPSQSDQDYRDALPECLMAAFSEEPFQQLQRTRPEAFTIADDPRQMRQWDKLLPRIKFYSTTRLFY